MFFLSKFVYKIVEFRFDFKINVMSKIKFIQFFFLFALSLFPPLFLGLELHKVVNLSVWRELCYLLAGPIYSELRLFAIERKTPKISALVIFLIDRENFFKDSKSNLNEILFYCAWKILALARFEPQSRWNENFQCACSPSELAGPASLYNYCS